MTKKVKGAVISFEVTDDGSLKLIDQQSKKTGKSLGGVGKSAGDVRRNMQAMSGRVESGTKGFARMQQGTGGLVQSYAILASTLFAVGAAFRALQNAANVENQIKGFRSLAEITGQSMMGVTAAIRSATGGLLNFQDAAQQAAIGVAAGFSQEQLRGLAEGAKLASVTLGRDLTDSFNRLVRGVTKAEPELLDELGIILRLDIATRKFANANGLIAEKLTIAQRRAAVFEEVQRQLIANFGAMEDEGDELLNPFDRLLTKINDFIITIQGPFVKAFGAIADFISSNFGALVTVVTMFSLSILKQIVPSFQQMGIAAENAGKRAKKRIQALEGDILKQKKGIKAVEKEFKASEVRKNIFFKKELKRRGITLKQFSAMSLKEQKKLVQSMMLDEKRGLAHTKKFNRQRYQSYKAVFTRIQLESKRTQKTLIAHAQIAGAQIRMALVKPLIQVQAGLAAVGVMASRLAPIFATLGAIVNAAFAIIMGFFTAKFVVDLLPITKRINASFEAINETGKILEETVRDLAHTIAGDLSDKRIAKIKEEFEGLEGQVLAANYQIERLDNILKRGQTGKNFIEDLEDSISKNFGQGQEEAMMGKMFGFLRSGSSGRRGYESKAYRAQVKNIVMQLQSVALKEFEALEATGRDGFAFGTFESLFTTAGMDKKFGQFKKDFEEIMEMDEGSTKKSALAKLMQDTSSILSSDYAQGSGFLEITKEGNVIITDTVREMLRLGDVGIEAFSKITGVIPGTRAAAKELKETLQNMMPKPSEAESTMSGIAKVLNEFTRETKDGRVLKDFSVTKEGMESIAKVANDVLGINIEITENHKEDAKVLQGILEREERRLQIADFLIDSGATFNAALKGQQNMVKFLNTTASKRYQLELQILSLKEQQVQNLAKYEIKNTDELITLLDEVEENRQHSLRTIQTQNSELQTQIDLLYAMKDPIEMLGKTLLEAFDNSGVQSLTKLIDTANLSEYSGKDMIKDMAVQMKKSTAKLMAENVMRPITGFLTPKAFKNQQKLSTAEQILAAHQKHINGLASVLDQHVKAMPNAKGGVSASNITGQDITKMTKGDLYGKDNPLEGGFREAITGFGTKIKEFIFGRDARVGISDFDIAGYMQAKMAGVGGNLLPEGLKEGDLETLLSEGKLDPVEGLPNIFERFFGADGMFSKVGKKLFGEDGMFSKIGGKLFGEGGMLSGLFSGEGGLFSGLKDMFGGLFGGGGGGGGIFKTLLSGIGGMFGIPLPFAKGGIIGNKTIGLEKGGIARYAKGGIAKQPTYLVGEGKQNEAVVPLPDNKSIPVDLGKGAGNTNNTNITVNVSDSGTDTKMEADGQRQLGQAINAAVLAELEKQQRPGGILARA